MLTNKRKLAISVRTREGIQVLLQEDLDSWLPFVSFADLVFVQSYCIREPGGKPFKANSLHIKEKKKKNKVKIFLT